MIWLNLGSRYVEWKVCEGIKKRRKVHFENEEQIDHIANSQNRKKELNVRDKEKMGFCYLKTNHSCHHSYLRQHYFLTISTFLVEEMSD